MGHKTIATRFVQNYKSKGGTTFRIKMVNLDFLPRESWPTIRRQFIYFFIYFLVRHLTKAMGPSSTLLVHLNVPPCRLNITFGHQYHRHSIHRKVLHEKRQPIFVPMTITFWNLFANVLSWLVNGCHFSTILWSDWLIPVTCQDTSTLSSHHGFIYWSPWKCLRTFIMD